MTSSFEKFKILIWKNWTIQKRHWKGGIFEILLPFLIVLIFTYVKKNIDFDTTEGELYVYPIPTDFSANRDDECPSSYFANGAHMSPNSSYLTDMVRESLKDIGGLQFHTYRNAAALNEFLGQEFDERKKPLLAIEFDDNIPVSKPTRVNTFFVNFVDN